MKNILIKLLVVISVLILIHSVFWFFKTGQLEKHINNFVTENAANVSIGSINVSGYPIAQKVTITDLKFLIPNPALNENRVIVKEVEISSSIFSNEFEVNITGEVMVQRLANEINRVEFNGKPQISLSVVDDRINNFSYKDNGYRIFDVNKNILYSASSSSINIKSVVNESEQISSKININITEMEGFDLIDIYTNSFEKKVIDGIKTGEIIIGSNSLGNSALADQFSIASSPLEDLTPPKNPDADKMKDVAAAVNAEVGQITKSAQEAVKKAEQVMEEQKKLMAAKSAQIANNKDVAVKDVAVVPPIVGGAVPTVVAGNAAAVATTNMAVPVDDATKTVEQSQLTENSQKIDSLLKEEAELVKNNLSIEIDYILTPTKTDQQLTMPLDPLQMQAATQYSRSFKINNFDFSNQFYKISVNGQIDYFQDDSMPSGFASIKVENASKLISYLDKSFNEIANSTGSKLQSFDASLDSDVSQDAYRDFLKKVSSSLADVVKEISAKNQLSQGDVAVLDIRREKNLEFIINETPVREILGKF